MQIETGCGVAQGDDAFLAGKEAARQALANVAHNCISVVIVFASIHFKFDELLAGIRSVTGDAPLIGSSSAGEICRQAYEKSVVVTVLASPYLQVRVGIGRNVSRNWQDALAEALANPALLPFFSADRNQIWHELTTAGKSLFAMLFTPGNTRHADAKSYEIMEGLKRLSLGRIPIVGGASADDWRMEANYVFRDREAHPDTMLIALFETSLKFGIATAHGFRASDRQAIATSVKDHEIVRLNGEAAADVYARLVNVPREKLEGKHLTFTTGFPLGIREAMGDFSLIAASYFTPAGGVRITQPLSAGMTITVMEPVQDDMVLAGREAIRKAVLRSSITAPAVGLIFSCALRSRILNDSIHEEMDRAGALFPSMPLAGFYSFGEQGVADDGISRHSNEIVAALLIGSELSYPARVAHENLQLRKELEKKIGDLDLSREALRESEENYRSLVETIDDMVIIGDRHGRIIYANAATAAKLGYRPDELCRMSITELHPEFARTEAEIILKAMIARKRNTCPLPYVSKGGIVIPVETRVWFGKWNGADCIFGVSRDLSKEQEALQKFDRFFRMNPALMAVSSLPERTFVDVNDSFLRTLGYTADEIIGRTSNELELFNNQEEKKRVDKILAEFGRIYDLELQVKTKDGNIRHGLFSGDIIESQGASYILTVMIDITERKRLDEDKIRLIEKLNEANEILRSTSIVDQLTGISNRRYFDNCLDREWHRAIRNQKPISMIFIDIDFFKSYNDNYGHVEGDRCLRVIAQQLHAAARRPGDLFARYGGEEFALLLPETDEGSLYRAEQCRKIVEKLSIPHEYSKIANYVTISLGVSTLVPAPDSEPVTIVRAADRALYRAKLKGRNRVEKDQ